MENRGLSTGALNIFCNLMHVLVCFGCFDKIASSLVVKALWEILKLQIKSLLRDPGSLSSSSAKLRRAVIALGAKDGVFQLHARGHAVGQKFSVASSLRNTLSLAEILVLNLLLLTVTSNLLLASVEQLWIHTHISWSRASSP